jgi:hypothetical protein
MAEKNLVEETLLQIQNLEDVINENAKEILASTMKEEISELVKESMKQKTDEEVEMKEQPEEEEEEESEEEEEMEMGAEDEESDEEMDMEDSEEMDMDDMDDMEMSMDMDDEITDLTDLEDTPENAEMIAQIFKNMKDSDEVTVVQDGDYTKLTDNEADTEYLIQTEGTEDELEEGEEDEYEYELEEGMDEFDESMQEPDTDLEESEEVVYEIELDEPTEELDEEEYEFELEEGDVEDNESYKPVTEAKKSKKMETKEGMKPKVGKGAKLGSAKKFSYKKSAGGFKETMKKANPTKGTGKPKFEFKEGVKMEKMPKKETKEASRTYGMGWRKGALPKGARTGSSKARQDESVDVELQLLRAKNEEYRKALNMFREKLNEVAVFNSNLAYATRLFTEHSTSKQEKINILRRFDSADTLKESKALYKSIKDELTTTNVKSTHITESIERVIDREPQQSGSAINLIESKTYENPQFLRMKDIMSKIAK